GEMHYIPAGLDSYIQLPHDGGVAYAAQESWVQNETISYSQNNIVFGMPYNEERYNRGMQYICVLKCDLDLFKSGNATEVGEKGITLR
ncbi:uncharacterized protein LAESUDRAFT_656777, partial [Laetiporus sulphureus 93-53]